MSNVRSYIDKQLIERVKKLYSFKGIPTGIWLLGVRSDEDAFDSFDDKIYVFKGMKCIKVLCATTNSGKYGLMNYAKWNSKGCAVLKSDEWYYDLWANGMHKGKLKALVQVGNCLIYRDNNKDKRCDETGPVYKGKFGINCHAASYNTEPSFIKKYVAKYIGAWSVGCQVIASLSDYYYLLSLTANQKRITYCLIKEF